MHAISSQFSKVRSFVFIDGIDEVTRFFESVDDVAEAVHRINTEADVVWVDGHSDYGHALSVFWERWGEEITPRTSVLLLGDARNNYHASQAWVVQEIRHRARHVYWLNPEPRAYWGTGRLHPRRVRRALRRRVRVPEPAPARAVRRPSWRERAGPAERAGAPPGRAHRARPPSERPTRVVLIRHGEAVCNVDRRGGRPRGVHRAVADRAGARPRPCADRLVDDRRAGRRRRAVRQRAARPLETAGIARPGHR